MMKAVIYCGVHTKKAEVCKELNGIKAYVRTTFGIDGDFFVKYMDPDVNDWIDIDDAALSELPGDSYTKMKVVLISAEESSPSSTIQVQTPCASPSTSASSSTPVLLPSPQQPSTSQNASRSNSPSSDIHSPLPSLDSKSKQTRTPGPKRQLKQWPKVYSIPYHCIPRGIILSLESGKDVEGKERRELLTAIYQDVTLYEGGCYPTADRYNQIVDALFREFPQLATVKGLTPGSTQELWRMRIQSKFQNNRRRLDSLLPEVISHKKPRKHKETVHVEDAQAMWGLKNFLPQKPVTEDEHTTAAHVAWLKKEYKKRAEDQDLATVDSKMAITLFDRRKKIIEDNESIESILIEYPWLQSSVQLTKEFMRLGPSVESHDINEAFSEGLDEYSRAFEVLTGTKKNATKAREVRQRKMAFRTEDEKKHADRCATLLSIPSMFQEDVNKLVMSEENAAKSVQPSKFQIIGNDTLSRGTKSFSVVIEGVIVLKVDDLVAAFLGFLLAIYAFNLAYPKCLARSCLFLQKIILSMKDELPIDKRLLTVIDKLNRV